MSNVHYQKNIVTIYFLTASCLISLVTWFGAIESTFYWFIFDVDLISDGQVWRIITPIFLHFPALGIIFAHLAFNMIWLYQFGLAIERSEGPSFYSC